eukprot:TRINITY_DN8670_c0_g1_i1.p1 TRINITY_DN8670_c0_g1~~TRINITY_DN8670_c0_g1_i1.p1  ORF type:complete len:302 (+),score=60.07 TRINITY_DN8670_c0_g1_i1:42-947(+)
MAVPMLPPLPLRGATSQSDSAVTSRWHPTSARHTEMSDTAFSMQASALASAREADRAHYEATRQSLMQQAAELSQAAASMSNGIGAGRFRSPRFVAEVWEVGSESTGSDLASNLSRLRKLQIQSQELRRQTIEARAATPVIQSNPEGHNMGRKKSEEEKGGKGKGKGKSKAFKKDWDSHLSQQPKPPGFAKDKLDDATSEHLAQPSHKVIFGRYDGQRELTGRKISERVKARGSNGPGRPVRSRPEDSRSAKENPEEQGWGEDEWSWDEGWWDDSAWGNVGWQVGAPGWGNAWGKGGGWYW